MLIANRGEITVRIARTCRELGIQTVGVYSQADRCALHTEVVDEAYEIGPALAAESYLRQDKIIAIAMRSGCDAIHPGYGFLAENSGFAQAVLDTGLIWIGPPPSAISAMGLKTSARKLMTAAGVPVVPGSDGPVASANAARDFSRQHGFPFLLKAAAGGGGKGMRFVRDAKEIESAFESAKREAVAAFGDGTLYIEKFIERPRHIEIQVFADQQGHVIHLGERECSLQRRHQKIIEESPSAVVTPNLREKMGETAIAVARACGYVNAGTVEMLLDQNENFYFLEMNTRLQVEHPVTEEVTGLDLVRLQLQVASGEPLPFSQTDIELRGHAIEVRIYAEDVPNGFLPSTGCLSRLRPATGPGLREDSGMREGAEISRFYDPMISKLIACAETREGARRRMQRALEEYEIAGVCTNIPFCRHILESDAFVHGKFHTRSVDEEFIPSYQRESEQPAPDESLLVVGLARVLLNSTMTPQLNGNSHHQVSPNWTVLGRQAGMRDS